MSDYILINGELCHHGVKGMKWGVRRYQKKDGTLTRRGKKLVDEGADLFPKYKGKQLGPRNELVRNRNAAFSKVGKERSERLLREYKKYIEEHPEFDKDAYDADQIWYGTLRSEESIRSERITFAKRFVEEYGAGTLKDLGIEATPQAKQFVEDCLRKNTRFASPDLVYEMLYGH